MLSAVASELFGFERGLGLDAGILVLMTIIFSYSVSAGLDKGIKLLSDVNVLLAIVLLFFIAAVGPTSFIINQGFDSLMIMFQNFVDMSLRMDAGGETSFAASNTVFFWAWWLAWAPFMGLFIAQISRGRTIKEVVLGCIAGGSGACWVGFSILGHSVQKSGESGTRCDDQHRPKGSGWRWDGCPLMVVELLKQLPMHEVMLFVFFILSLIFVSASLDSAAFTLAATASENLEADAQPARWHRLCLGIRTGRNRALPHVHWWAECPANRIHPGRLSTALCDGIHGVDIFPRVGLTQEQRAPFSAG